MITRDFIDQMNNGLTELFLESKKDELAAFTKKMQDEDAVAARHRWLLDHLAECEALHVALVENLRFFETIDFAASVFTRCRQNVCNMGMIQMAAAELAPSFLLKTLAPEILKISEKHIASHRAVFEEFKKNNRATLKNLGMADVSAS